MDAQTAHNVIKQLQLSEKDQKQLIRLLQGDGVRGRKGKVLTVTDAKQDFMKKIKNRLVG